MTLGADRLESADVPERGGDGGDGRFAQSRPDAGQGRAAARDYADPARPP